jgi:hypothetical protein
VARYRTKDEIDLAWNRIRRQITRDLDTRIQNFREELLNKALGDAWNKYAAALESGDVIQLEDEASNWVDAMLEAHRPAIEVAHGDLDEG